MITDYGRFWGDCINFFVNLYQRDCNFIIKQNDFTLSDDNSSRLYQLSIFQELRDKGLLEIIKIENNILTYNFTKYGATVVRNL